MSPGNNGSDHLTPEEMLLPQPRETKPEQASPGPQALQDTQVGGTDPIDPLVYHEAEVQQKPSAQTAPAENAKKVPPTAAPAAGKTAEQLAKDAASTKMWEGIKNIKPGQKLVDAAMISAEDWGKVGFFDATKAKVAANWKTRGIKMKTVSGIGTGLGVAGVLHGGWKAFKGLTGAEKIDVDGKVSKGDWGDVFLGGAEALGGVALGYVSLAAGGAKKFVNFSR